MSSNVSVIYCFITNNTKFPGVNNNNLFYSQICILGKIQWKQIIFLSQSISQGSSATADWNCMKIIAYIFIFDVGRELECQLELSVRTTTYGCLVSLQNANWFPRARILQNQVKAVSQLSLAVQKNYPKTYWNEMVCNNYLTVSLGQKSKHILNMSSVSGSLMGCNQDVNSEFCLSKI